MNSFSISAWSILLIMFCSCTPENNPPDQYSTGYVEFTKATKATDAQGNTYKIGFDQVSSINQDPYIEKTDTNGKTVWRLRYEETPVDGKGVLIAMMAGKLYAVFSVDGGSTSNTYINKHHVVDGAFSGVFQGGYEKGGGPKVSIICQIDPARGKILKGTFMTARLNSGNTNSLSIKEIGLVNGKLALRVTAAAWPPATGKSYLKMSGIDDSDRINNSFWLYYEMEPDFSEISKAELLRETF